ncbi:hypothetical protein FDZ71_00345 [bacterium]|nr:MAG: hypothetical protein FDZ71_00345 [bacterium]
MALSVLASLPLVIFVAWETHATSLYRPPHACEGEDLPRAGFDTEAWAAHPAARAYMVANLTVLPSSTAVAVLGAPTSTRTERYSYPSNPVGHAAEVREWRGTYSNLLLTSTWVYTDRGFAWDASGSAEPRGWVFPVGLAGLLGVAVTGIILLWSHRYRPRPATSFDGASPPV